MKALLALLLCLFAIDASAAAPRPLVSITYTGGVSSYLGTGSLDVIGSNYARLYGIVGDNTYSFYIKSLTTPRVISADIKIRRNEVDPSDGASVKFVYYDAPEFVTSGCGIVVNTYGTCTLNVIYSPSVASGLTTGPVLRVFFNNSTVPYRIYTLDTYVE